MTENSENSDLGDVEIVEIEDTPTSKPVKRKGKVMTDELKEKLRGNLAKARARAKELRAEKKAIEDSLMEEYDSSEDSDDNVSAKLAKLPRKILKEGRPKRGAGEKGTRKLKSKYDKNTEEMNTDSDDYEVERKPIKGARKQPSVKSKYDQEVRMSIMESRINSMLEQLQINNKKPPKLVKVKQTYITNPVAPSATVSAPIDIPKKPSKEVTKKVPNLMTLF
jgi:hypothetical protein